MESPLNKAHYLERRAVTQANNYKFDEASYSYSQAAEYFKKALDLSENIRAKECILLQYQCSKKQEQFMRLKKFEFEAYQEVLKVHKETMLRVNNVKSLAENSNNKNEGITLETAIYRTIEEADSLLELLVHRNDTDIPQSCDPVDDSTAPVVDPANVTGCKKPKDETTVIEELRIVNYQLRTLIKELMSQVAEREAEVVQLKSRIQELEQECLEKEKSGCSCRPETNLPALPPLHMPDFELHMPEFEHSSLVPVVKKQDQLQD